MQWFLFTLYECREWVPSLHVRIRRARWKPLLELDGFAVDKLWLPVYQSSKATYKYKVVVQPDKDFMH